jgi:hypothetical protein
MDFLSGADTISQLSSLLAESREAANAYGHDGGEAVPPKATGPTKVVLGPAGAVGATKKPVEDPKAIWRDEEIPLEDSIVCRSDGRPAPRFEFSYKQVVGTEDTFLGLGTKTPGSADASALVIKIHFPGETLRGIQLDVTRNRIKAESRALSLFTYLPVEVEHDKGTAKFDSEKQVLTVTLPIINELAMP